MGDLRQQASDAERRCRSLEEDLEDAHRRQRFPTAVPKSPPDSQPKDNNKTLQAANAALQKQVASLKSQAQSHQAQLEEARRGAESGWTQAGVLRERVAALEEKLKASDMEENCAAERSAWQEERQELRSAKAKLEEQLAARRQEAAEARRHMQDALNALVED